MPINNFNIYALSREQVQQVYMCVRIYVYTVLVVEVILILSGACSVCIESLIKYLSCMLNNQTAI